MIRLLSFGLVAVCVVAGGLFSGASQASAETVLRWASAGDALTLDPHAQNEGPTNAMSRQIYEPLVNRDPQQEMIPALATEWRALDKETWEFRLREGVTFHDGTALTAEDVVFSLNRARHPKSDFKTLLANMADVRAIDAQTIHVTTSAPVPLMADGLTQIFIMSKAWTEANDALEPQKFAAGEENYAVRHANGTGPFKLDLREQDVRTRLVRNDTWWGLAEQPHNIDVVLYTPVSNPSTRIAALLSGEIDFLLDPPLQDLARLEATPTLKVLRTPQMRTIFLGMDQGRDELRSSDIKGKNPFADVRVRQAMYQAINIEAIKKKIMRGESAPAGIITAPGVHGWTPQLDERLDYDVQAAKDLLAEAGYADGFSVKLDCPNDRYINDEAICQAVVGMLAKIGIRVALDSQPKALHFPKIENRETDFYMLGWGVPTVDSEYVFNFLYKTGASWNAAAYSNPALDDLIVGMTTEFDTAERDRLINEAWEMAKADIVYLPIHHQILAWGLSKDLDLPIDSNDSPQFFYARMK